MSDFHALLAKLAVREDVLVGDCVFVDSQVSEYIFVKIIYFVFSCKIILFVKRIICFLFNCKIKKSRKYGEITM